MVSTLPRARHALAFGIAMALVGGATAATAPQRFTPVLGEGAALYPQSPASTGTPPRAIDAAQGDIDNLVVEVAGNDLPADGQTATTVRVRLLGADGQPLRGAHPPKQHLRQPNTTCLRARAIRLSAD